jgi:hypothetical protein
MNFPSSLKTELNVSIVHQQEEWVFLALPVKHSSDIQGLVEPYPRWEENLTKDL